MSLSDFSGVFLSHIKVLCIAQNHITVEFILQLREDPSTPVDSENTGFRNPYLSRRSETTSPVLPTVPKRHRPVRSNLGHIPTRGESRSGCCVRRTLGHSTSFLTTYQSESFQLQFLYIPQQSTTCGAGDSPTQTGPPLNSVLAVQFPLAFHNKTHPRICLLLPLHDPFVLSNH